MVVPIGAFGDGDLKVGDVAPWPLVPDQFGVEQRVQSLRHGIVVTIALGARRSYGFLRGEALGTADGPILNPLSLWGTRPVWSAPSFLRIHFQGIQNERRIKPATERADVRGVGDPAGPIRENRRRPVWRPHRQRGTAVLACVCVL